MTHRQRPPWVSLIHISSLPGSATGPDTPFSQFAANCTAGLWWLSRRQTARLEARAR